MFDSDETSTTQLAADLYVANSPGVFPFNPQLDTSVPGFLRVLPRLDTVEEARELVAKLQQRPPQCLICDYNLDLEKPSEMRSSALCSGVIALAVEAGHRAIISARSAQLPMANWRSEFVFRAVRGIRLIRPELSQDRVLYLVTRAIHFCTLPDQAEAQAIH